MITLQSYLLQDVTSIAPGARVFLAESVSGTYAQYALATAEAVIALPEKLSYSQGAAISVPYKTAFLGLKVRPFPHFAAVVIINDSAHTRTRESDSVRTWRLGFEMLLFELISA
jgi:NADPH:quinone reductase-like Zn-dependent oxidoreductase